MEIFMVTSPYPKIGLSVDREVRADQYVDQCTSIQYPSHMRSFLPAALALAVSAIQAALVAEEIPSTPPVSAEAVEPNQPTDTNSDAAKILRVVIPKDGKLDRAEVEFEFTDGQAVSAFVGQP